MSTTVFTYRIRPPVGLERTLIKELKSLNLTSSPPEKIKGRKIIEVKGTEETLWKIMFKSRIAEDIQVRMTQPFLARGEKELETNLDKLPWHCYLPSSTQKQETLFKMPQTRAKTHKSKLFHTQLIRDILIRTMTESQIKRDYKLAQAAGTKKNQQSMPFRQFKKEWLEKREEREQKEVKKKVKEELSDEDESDIDGHKVDKGRGRKIKGLDQVKAELKAKAEVQKNLKELSKFQVNIVKNIGEVLVGTSNEELHKHGYKPFIRWGVLKETLTAACILESGIIQKANKTGKLYLWDPFCGSGSFLIETLMMLLEQPVRNFDEALPFQYWPIHQREKFEEFKSDLNDYQKMVKKNDIDIQLIGSDISQRAIETSIKNCDYADIQSLIENGLVEPRAHSIINNPMILTQHYPRAYQKNDVEAATTQLIDFKQSEKNVILSLYHGDFQKIGSALAPLTEDFKDFSILTNVPYGHQSKEKQHHSDTDLQNLYRRFGKFIRQYPTLEYNTFVLAQGHHYSHKLSFEKFSNCGWDKVITFNNGGLGVQLLRFDMSKVSESKKTIQAYKQISELGTKAIDE